MNRGLSDRLRCLIISSAAPGLLLPSAAVFGQTTNAVPSNKPKPAVAQVVEPPKLLSVPGASDSTANPIRPVSEIELAAADKSDVQRELEALYEQDGREMPTLKLQPLAPLQNSPQQNSSQQTPTQQSDATKNPAATRPAQPKPTTTQKPAANPAQNYQGYSAKPGATVYPSQIPPVQAPAQTPRYSSLFNDHPNATPAQPPQPPSQTSRFGFFKRLTSSNKPQYNPSPVPPDYRDIPASVPTTPPASAANATAASPPPQNMKYYAPPTQKPVSAPAAQPIMNTVNTNGGLRQNGTDLQFLTTNNSVLNLPEPAIPMPPLYQEPLPILSSRITVTPEPSTLPPLMTQPQSPSVAEIPAPAVDTTVTKVAEPNAKIATAATITETATDFPNPFPEVSEAEVDGRSSKPVKRREVSSKTYTEEEKPNSTALKTAKPEVVEHEAVQNPVAKSEDDPYAVGAKNFAEPPAFQKTAPKTVLNDNEFLPPVVAKSSESTAINPPKSAHPLDDSKIPEFDAAKVLETPSAKVLETPPADDKKLTPETSPSKLADGNENQKLDPPSNEEEQHLEKMKKIRERFGMKGLKGFCPVTLHDERDLIDAKPEFHSTHRSQKFHFATADARDKFDADPVKYAPAAYGADVVALGRDRDVVEGTLDFAAWFKGRLYLFGTQENYDIFINNPAKYATLNGIE